MVEKNGKFFFGVLQVHMKPESPMPPTALLWRRHARPEARAWEMPFICAQQHYNSLFPVEPPGYVNLGDD